MMTSLAIQVGGQGRLDHGFRNRSYR